MGVTIKDIAKLAGVSTATVSKIINKKDGFISEATKENVNKIINEYNYIPNIMARSLVMSKTKTIGIIIPDILNPFFTQIVRGVENEVRTRGYSLIIMNSDDNEVNENYAIHFLSQGNIDGLIFASGGLKNTREKFQMINVPFVSIDKLVRSSKQVGSVNTDLEACGYLAAKYFLDKGLKDIAFICGSKSFIGSKLRYKGFVKAFEEKGLEINEKLIKFGEYSHEFGREAMGQLLAESEIQAVACMSDMLALGVMSFLREKKISIPKGVAVLGVDDVFFSKLLDKPLSTISRDPYYMGKKGAEILLNYLEKTETAVVNEVLHPVLVERKTT